MTELHLSRREVLRKGSRLLAGAALAATGVLALSADEAGAVSLPGLPAVVSSSSGLNLRTGPSSTRSVIRWLGNGTPLSVIGTVEQVIG